MPVRLSHGPLCVASAILMAGLATNRAPAKKGGGKGGNQDGGSGTSALFTRADFRTVLQSGDAAQMLSDLEGSPLAPVALYSCLPPFDYWDSRFDSVCTDPSSGPVESSLSPADGWLTTKNDGIARSEAELISGAETAKRKDDQVIGTYCVDFEIAAQRIDGTDGCPSTP